ncbi:hypothetical protein IAD21_05047 [Abditibacteriota bacterium]|nr:hypothetical protein IAD21_05047 [Abditibacteriota bacterium]
MKQHTHFALGTLALLTVATVLPTLAAPKMGMMGRQRVMMMPLPPAQMAGLQKATGYADVNVKTSTLKISVTLPPGKSLPAGTVLEGWLSTSGKSTASSADEKFGPAFGKSDLAMKLGQTPYALSTGLLRRVGHSRTYVGHFHIDNPLTPYGAVAVTLESDGNIGNYDPRPGTPLMGGPLKAESMMKSTMMG